MKLQQLIDLFCVEIAELGYHASYDLMARIIVEKKGELFYPHVICAQHIPEVMDYISLTEYGKQLRNRLLNMKDDETHDVAMEMYDKNMSILRDALIHITDPKTNKQTLHIMLLNENYCNDKGEHVQKFFCSKNPEIDTAVILSWHRALVKAEILKNSISSTDPVKWE